MTGIGGASDRLPEQSTEQREQSEQSEQSEQPEQREQSEQPEQRKQSEQSEQPEQPEQRKQSEQPEQRKQSEQSAQREQSEQSEQSTQFSHFLKLSSASCAFSLVPQFSTEHRLPFLSSSQFIRKILLGFPPQFRFAPLTVLVVNHDSCVVFVLVSLL
jgi:hypothetical protein